MKLLRGQKGVLLHPCMDPSLDPPLVFTEYIFVDLKLTCIVHIPLHQWLHGIDDPGKGEGTVHQLGSDLI